MKLDPDLIHYLTKDHFRVLTAVEMGMKNHEFVPVPLIESLAALKRGNAFKVIQFLLKHKLIMHFNKQYDGQGTPAFNPWSAINDSEANYARSQGCPFGGYDYLALKAFMKRNTVKQVILKIGVGKESDIYLCENNEGDVVVVKFARLGRTSFRTVKENRDYLKGRAASSWLYLSRIASLKEFAFMKALYNKGFPTPVPIDSNRHAIVMSHIKGYPLAQIRELQNPHKVYEALLEQIIHLAEHGLVHGDFNEFNLMINDDEQITIIDFPQMTSTSHPNAQFYFSRDVVCVQEYFAKRFGMRFEGVPVLETDIERAVDLDREIKASGFNEEELKAMENIHEMYLDKQEEDIESSEEEDDGEPVDPLEVGAAAEGDESSSDEDLEDDPNRKVKFAPVEKKEEDAHKSEESEESDDAEPKEDKNHREKKTTTELAKKDKKKKLVINEEYVKDKVKKQFWNKEKKSTAKRNKNKDKKVMKDQETIKDYFID